MPHPLNGWLVPARAGTGHLKLQMEMLCGGQLSKGKLQNKRLETPCGWPEDTIKHDHYRSIQALQEQGARSIFAPIRRPSERLESYVRQYGNFDQSPKSMFFTVLKKESCPIGSMINESWQCSFAASVLGATFSTGYWSARQYGCFRLKSEPLTFYWNSEMSYNSSENPKKPVCGPSTERGLRLLNAAYDHVMTWDFKNLESTPETGRGMIKQKMALMHGLSNPSAIQPLMWFLKGAIQDELTRIVWLCTHQLGRHWEIASGIPEVADADSVFNYTCTYKYRWYAMGQCENEECRDGIPRGRECTFEQKKTNMFGRDVRLTDEQREKYDYELFAKETEFYDKLCEGSDKDTRGPMVTDSRGNILGELKKPAGFENPWKSSSLNVISD